MHIMRTCGFVVIQFMVSLHFLAQGAASSAGVGPEKQKAELAEAQSAEEQGLYEEAIRKYRAVLGKSPASAAARLGMGRSLARLGRCREAANVLEKTTGSARARGEGEKLLGICHFGLGEFDTASVHLAAAAKLAPRDKEARIYLSRAWAAAGRYEKAIRSLNSWLEQNGDDVDVLYWVGKFYDELAARAFDTMLALNPDHYLVHQLEGDQFTYRKDYKEALAAIDRAMAAAPNAPGLHYSRGNVFWRQRSLEKAREELEKELQINPNHAQANYLLGDIFVSLREPKEAIPYLQKAVSLNPEIWDAHRSLGRALVMENKFEAAVREFQIVAKANPTDDTIHGLLANAYRRLGNMDKAMEESRIFKELNAARRERVPKPTIEKPPAANPQP
jgi:tetratricopeptide (TPR) repeat protein